MTQVTLPENFQAVYVSEYLKSRRYNHKTVERASEAIRPLVEAYNAEVTRVEDLASLRWCMNAKYQTQTAVIETKGSADFIDGYQPPRQLDNLIGRIENVLVDHFDTMIEFEGDDGHAIADLE